MKSLYDVIVVGGGTAGVIAALQAGRAGARTLLIEKNGMLGGAMVTAAIPHPACFFAHEKQIIAGLGWELCLRAGRETGAPPPSAQAPKVVVNSAIFAAVADEQLLAAGVEILLHTMPAAARFEENIWKLTVCVKTGLRELRAKNLIDCTGDANMVELAGLPVRRNADLQSATLVFRLSGYDAQTLNYDAIQKAFENEVEAGHLKHADAGWSRGKIKFVLCNYGGNKIHVAGVDASTSVGKTQAELEARRVMLRLLRFFRKQRGLETLTIDYCAAECGIRETVTIIGKQTVAIADYAGGRFWNDAVCYSYYCVDIHRADHCETRKLPDNVWPTIPLRALLPKDSRHIIVAGRCAAGDQEANSAYRVQASCMAMGQAAGAAAALAAQLDKDFEEIPLANLYALLRRHAAILPGDIK